MRPPSRNPANDDSMPGLFREVLRKALQNTDDMLPARVEVYDRATNRARVRPIIQVITTEGDRITRADVASVPVLLLGGGNFFLGFDLPAGSLGWLKASDRDISLFLQSYEESAPNTRRMHTFEDALFIPDIMRGHTIAGEDAQAAVLQNLDGTVRLSMTDDRIKMTVGGTTVTIDDGTVTVSGANMIVDGNVDATGTVTGDTDVVSDGTSLRNHVHQGSPTAPSGMRSDTGLPV